MSENGWKVLIIDDEEGIRRVLSLALTDTGYEVFTAADGESGIRVCQEKSPQVVITDIRMPGMDGIDVLKRIKEQDPDKEVIVVTGFGQLEAAIRALRLNASDFITKPINHDALLVALQRAKARYMSRKELRESEGKYGTLVENSLTGIYIDQDGRVQFANKKFAEIYGYAKDELMGMEAWRLVHPEYRAMTDETRAKRLRGEETLPQYEAKGLRKDGETIWIVRRNTRIEYRGRPAILGNIVDITSRKRAEEALHKARDELEQRVKVRTAALSTANKQLRREIEDRKRAEEELRRSETKYRLLFNHDPNPLFVVDMDSCKILDVNDPATVTYEYERKEMLGMPFSELFDPAETDRLWGGLRHFAGRESIFLPKLWARKRGGHCFFIHLHARAGNLKESDSGDLGGTMIVRTVDIAQRLEQEAQLIQASKMATLGEMATGIAHELNQPLNVMRVGTDFLAKMINRGEKISEEQLLGVSRNVSTQVDRATYIINHLREFGRKTDLGVYPVDLNEPIQDIFTLLGEQLRLRNIEVKLKLAEGLSKILSDKNRLEQIFLNLVTNARDAMEAKGPKATKKLTITTYQEGDRVVVVISDTGAGMPENIRDKIFEPFFTTKEVGEGTGLGLSITYNLVKAFKGELHVESASGVGTTFKLAFPVHQEEGDPHGKVTRH